jgi:YesN/AraC family two-component response regulator
MYEYTVLFVDDEPFILNSMQRLFHDDKINVMLASSGQEALDLVKNGSIQVLVTDNLMPGMTGVELVHRAKDSSPDTVRILLSGYSDMDAVLHALNDGEVFRFVMKPWDDLDLKTTVHLALAQYHLVEQHHRLQAEMTTLRPLALALEARYPSIHKELIEECKVSAESDCQVKDECEMRT